MIRACQVNVAILVSLLLAFSSRSVAGSTRLGANTRGSTGRRKLQLNIAGDSGNPPPEMLPLDRCWGDCDVRQSSDRVMS